MPPHCRPMLRQAHKAGDEPSPGRTSQTEQDPWCKPGLREGGASRVNTGVETSTPEGGPHSQSGVQSRRPGRVRGTEGKGKAAKTFSPQQDLPVRTNP